MVALTFELRTPARERSPALACVERGLALPNKPVLDSDGQGVMPLGSGLFVSTRRWRHLPRR